MASEAALDTAPRLAVFGERLVVVRGGFPLAFLARSPRLLASRGTLRCFAAPPTAQDKVLFDTLTCSGLEGFREGSSLALNPVAPGFGLRAKAC